jgi:aspartyl-tRNA(Asn)/glutamyl-tRNA(Gln) amidotransferase subunit C
MSMSSLSKADVLHVAKLAKITLSEEEVEKFGKQLSEVVNYVGQLNEVDTQGVEPTSQTTGLEDVFRTDELGKGESLTKDEALSSSENIHNNYFVVDAVLAERSDK